METIGSKTRLSWIAATIAAVVLPPVVFISGCSSSRNQPTVSGLDLFGTRVVRVGEQVDVSIPAEVEAGKPPEFEWRLESFDSLILEPMGAPSIQQFDSTHFSVMTRFKASLPGETTIVFGKYAAAAPGTRTDERRFSIRVVP